MKISILAFDLSDNATGRADLLARLLAPRWDVEVVGPRFGARVWGPVAGGPIVHRALPARRRALSALRLGVGARSPRRSTATSSTPPSRGRPATAPRCWRAGAARRPLLLDIDDWEVGFFRRSDAWGTLGRALNLGNPNGLPWTWLMERLVPRADALTVASRFLERRFGGTLVPHVRDTEAWDPARFDRGGGARGARPRRASAW